MDFERSIILKEIQFVKKNGFINLFGNEPYSWCENKNIEKSLAVRKLANQLFTKKNHDAKLHEEVWKLYTESIAYATNESEELAAGYANRSALLLHLKKYSECLLDINRALKITESSALKVKLHRRQIECHVALQDGNEKNALEKANYLLNKIGNVKERQKLKEMIEKSEKAMTTDKPDPVKKEKEYDISCDNNALSISYNEKYGKHLVADRDISLGELVYVEKFYATSINGRKTYAYCSHCLAICWATIPCDQCSYYLYCSEECKKEAWDKYHDIECAVKFGKHPDSYLDYYVQLGLRALIMGFKETGSIVKLKKLISEIDQSTDFEIKGLIRNEKFCSGSFRSLYSLSGSKSIEKLRTCVPEIFRILVNFAKNTHIFGEDFKYTNNVDLMSNEIVIFTASLFLRLSSISFINAFELATPAVQCDTGKKFFACISEFCCSRGMTLSIFTSLMKHSCDNNVDKVYTNDGRVIYYAAKPIKKNSQIFSSYYCKFAKIDKASRHTILDKLFEIHCECIACKNDWPTFLDDLLDVKTELADNIFQKHLKLLDKISRRKKHRHSNKTIREFTQDVELLLKSVAQPDSDTYFFLEALCVIIENRYFVRLNVPNECKKNSSK